MITWDAEKNEKLKRERGVSFEEIKQLLLAGNYIDSIKNPSRPNQMIFILVVREYTYVVPYVVGTDGNVFLKIAYQSRKYHKKRNKHI